ncbi:MAG: NUDIX domain-containing protein [Actinomycetota bacterium]
MTVLSAGIALIRGAGDDAEILLVHPGGPFWRNKDEHAWSVPKGEVDVEDGTEPDGKTVEAAARREFSEETGHPAPDGPLIALPRLRLGSSSKRLQCFAAAGDLEPSAIVSNTFEMEWPPRSGRLASFPEVDRAAWFRLDDARSKLHKGQVPLVDLVRAELDRLLAPEDTSKDR